MDSKEIANEIADATIDREMSFLSKRESEILAKKLEGDLNGNKKDEGTKMIGSKEGEKEEFDEETMKKLKETYHKLMFKKFKTQFTQIYEYMLRKNLTISAIKGEIEEKKCNLPSDARRVVVNFKEDALLEYLADFEEKEENPTKGLVGEETL